MKLKITRSFRNKLNHQIDYIAQDKPSAAQKFKDDLLVQLTKLSSLPYSARKSIFFNHDHIRDLVFKGYVIVYKIDEEKDTITVFGFHKYKLKPF